MRLAATLLIAVLFAGLLVALPYDATPSSKLTGHDLLALVDWCADPANQNTNDLEEIWTFAVHCSQLDGFLMGHLSGIVMGQHEQVEKWCMQDMTAGQFIDGVKLHLHDVDPKLLDKTAAVGIMYAIKEVYPCD